jgi:2-methylcitrate dehydratase PrpD
MTRRIVMWAASLAVVAGLAAGLTAQAGQSEPRVLTDGDIGFRIDGVDRMSGKPMGTLVIRVNGEWIEPAAPMRGRPAASK